MTSSPNAERPAGRFAEALAARLRDTVPARLIRFACEIPPGCDPEIYAECLVIACDEQRPEGLDEIGLIQDKIQARRRARRYGVLADDRLASVKLIKMQPILEDVLAATGVFEEERREQARDLAIAVHRGSPEARSRLDAACAPSGLSFEALLETEAVCRDMQTLRALASLERSERKTERDSQMALKAAAEDRRKREQQQKVEDAGSKADRPGKPGSSVAPLPPAPSPEPVAAGSDVTPRPERRERTPTPASTAAMAASVSHDPGPEMSRTETCKPEVTGHAAGLSGPLAREAKQPRARDRQRHPEQELSPVARTWGWVRSGASASPWPDLEAGPGGPDSVSWSLGDPMDPEEGTAEGGPNAAGLGPLQQLARIPAFRESVEAGRTGASAAQLPSEDWRQGPSPATTHAEPQAHRVLDLNTLPPIDWEASVQRWTEAARPFDGGQTPPGG